MSEKQTKTSIGRGKLSDFAAILTKIIQTIMETEEFMAKNSVTVIGLFSECPHGGIKELVEQMFSDRPSWPVVEPIPLIQRVYIESMKKLANGLVETVGGIQSADWETVGEVVEYCCEKVGWDILEHLSLICQTKIDSETLSAFMLRPENTSSWPSDTEFFIEKDRIETVVNALLVDFCNQIHEPSEQSQSEGRQ